MVDFAGGDDEWDTADETGYENPEDFEQFLDGGESSEEREPETVVSDTSAAKVEEPAEVEPLYANVVEFVEEFFTQVIRRRMGQGGGEGGLAWDPRWALYPEVAGRLKALWFAFEEARASDKASAMSNWWIHHLEPHLRVILDGETGPMAHAKPNGEFTGWPALPYNGVPLALLSELLEDSDTFSTKARPAQQ